jgi:ribosomal protein S18 acetylase RimI-like enzyme
MITLVPMTEDEFQMYLEYSIQDYAQDRMKSGIWNEEVALGEAEQKYQQLLPQGLQTPQHYLFMVVDQQSAKKVGIIWFALHEQAPEHQARIYDGKVFEEFRRRGYATQVFQLLEVQAAELGATSVSLHVFGHNTAAREVYEKLGYVATDITMVKKLANVLII